MSAPAPPPLTARSSMPGAPPPPRIDDMHPLLRDRLYKPRSVFTPGHRMRMNVLPIILNVLVPWGIFLLCCGLTSFWIMYNEPHLVTSIIVVVFLIWVFIVANAMVARRQSPEPSWLTYVSVAFGLALITGTACGLWNFGAYTRPFYAIQDLKVVHQLDASRELGQNLMDAGIVYFAHGNHLDARKSWHFKHRTLYCVAPITMKGGAPGTSSYDFWAVGKDCCSTSSSDFRCGADWGSLNARAGIRVLDADDVTNYRLAVQQAETLYGIVAAHPIFFTWSKDPLHEVNSWNDSAVKNFVYMVAVAFVASLFLVIFAIGKFAWIGRAASAYNMDFYDDPEWRRAGMPGPVGYGTRGPPGSSP